MAALPERHHYEQLWARRDDDLFEICCIPFFVNDVSLGDLVRTQSRDGRTFVLDQVVRPSGHWTFRLWLGESHEDPLTVEAEFVAIGALTEWSSRHLLALDAGTDQQAQAVANKLTQGEKEARWLYETGRTT